MSHRVLSHAEFASAGGGSRRFSDASEGPESGYYVSRHPAQGGETKTEGRKATAVDVAAHWSHNRDRAMSSTPDPHEVYQGLWEDEGTSYLDVSDRVGTRSGAVSRGLQNKQKAVYDAKRGASVYLDPEGSDDSTPSATRTTPVRTKAHYKAAKVNAKVTLQ